MQAIENPYGITVFGSAVMRMAPDIASLKFAVSRLEQQPKDAFREAQNGAQAISKYLAKAGIDEVGSSRVSLSSTTRYIDGNNRFVGYTARIAFHVLLSDLARVEEVLVEVIAAGANEVENVTYQTTRLKEVRAEARRQAIAAAREKGEIYCHAAGVKLGRVVHIEDVNPDQLRGRGEGHVMREPALDDDGPPQALDPGSIVVGAAARVAFAIQS